MCGIAGVVNCEHSKTITEIILKDLSYRGPDNIGIYQNESQKSALGMCQLKIRSKRELIEEVPFHIGENIYAAYNGEIYLDKLNTGKEEAEYLYNHLYELNSTNVMAAIAIMNSAGTVLLAKDIMDIKPLYYVTLGNNSVAFSSELYSIAKLINFPVNLEVLDESLCFGRELGDKTIFNNCFSVMPGYIYSIEENGTIVINEFKKGFECNILKDYDLKQLLVSSIKKCTVGNRKLGLALSGGIDSAIIAGILNDLEIENIETISIKVDGKQDYVKNLDELGLPKGGCWEKWKHNIFEFTANDFKEVFHEAVCTYGGPTYMTSVPLYYILGRESAKLGINILLTGEGADELFFGYESYNKFDINDIVSPKKYLTKHLLKNSKSRYIYQLIGEKRFFRAVSSFNSKYSNLRLQRGSLLRSMEYQFSLAPLLRRTDHCLMKFGIEGRTPYLHNSLPIYAENINYNEVVSQGKGKQNLRELLVQYSNKKDYCKIPFRSPLETWFQKELYEWLVEELNKFNPLYRKLGYNINFVERIPSLIKKGNKKIISICYFLLTIGEYLSYIEESKINGYI